MRNKKEAHLVEKEARVLTEEKLREKQPLKFAFLQKTVQKNRMSHALLFSGNKGVGKEDFAYYLACAKLCEEKKDGLPCLACNTCRRVLKEEHPDVHLVFPIGQGIKVEQIRLIRDTLSRKSLEGKGQVVILHDAHLMNAHSSNSLLKTLEEPDGDVWLILLTSAPAKMLPTILSRVQEISLETVGFEVLVAELVGEGVVRDVAEVALTVMNERVLAKEVAGDEKFLQLKKDLDQFYKYVENRNLQGFVFVEKNLQKYWNAKDLNEEEKKRNQEWILLILLFYARKSLKEEANLSAEGLQHRLKVVEWSMRMPLLKQANVSMQNILEKFALNAIEDEKGW